MTTSMRTRETVLPWVPWVVAGITIAAAALYAVAASEPSLHQYYTPAVMSMAADLRSFVFGAFDSAGWSGIDKIPGALWPQALSVAVFGASSWSVILPEVLATVATIVVLYLAAARWRGRIAGLAAAAVYATMPLAAVPPPAG
jgi:4-amino-4-deoxy-L-arabinose transferase-like glycosyltransferase